VAARQLRQRDLVARHAARARPRASGHTGRCHLALIGRWRVVHSQTGEIGWQAKKPKGYVITPYVGVIDPFSAATAGVTIFCPEGEKDVDTLGQHGLPAFTFGGSSDVPKGCEEFVRGRDVVVLVDNDEPGRRWADKISPLFATTATNVRVVHFPDLPEGGDVSEWFEQGGTVTALLEHVENESACAPETGEGPLPLFPSAVPGNPYPVDALGPLAKAARAIASQVQAPESIAGQSVLAIASLAAQSIADVILPIGSSGQARPLSSIWSPSQHLEIARPAPTLRRCDRLGCGKRLCAKFMIASTRSGALVTPRGNPNAKALRERRASKLTSAGTT
jgi:hypothetical protein